MPSPAGGGLCLAVAKQKGVSLILGQILLRAGGSDSSDFTVLIKFGAKLTLVYQGDWDGFIHVKGSDSPARR
tara:strand:- start:1581 stop:1796 length:216 start_codon:yes stop_codon:yes gene_type:complete